MKTTLCVRVLLTWKWKETETARDGPLQRTKTLRIFTECFFILWVIGEQEGPHLFAALFVLKWKHIRRFRGWLVLTYKLNLSTCIAYPVIHFPAFKICIDFKVPRKVLLLSNIVAAFVAIFFVKRRLVISLVWHDAGGPGCKVIICVCFQLVDANVHILGLLQPVTKIVLYAIHHIVIKLIPLCAIPSVFKKPMPVLFQNCALLIKVLVHFNIKKSPGKTFGVAFDLVVGI